MRQDPISYARNLDGRIQQNIQGDNFVGWRDGTRMRRSRNSSSKDTMKSKEDNTSLEEGNGGWRGITGASLAQRRMRSNENKTGNRSQFSELTNDSDEKSDMNIKNKEMAVSDKSGTKNLSQEIFGSEDKIGIKLPTGKKEESRIEDISGSDGERKDKSKSKLPTERREENKIKKITGSSDWRGIILPLNQSAMQRAKLDSTLDKFQPKAGDRSTGRADGASLDGQSSTVDANRNAEKSTLKFIGNESHKRTRRSAQRISVVNRRSADAPARMHYSEIYSPANDSYFYDMSRDGESAGYVCESRVRHLEPAWGETVQGEVLEIVHSGDLPQHLAVEVCKYKSGGCGFLAAGVQSICRQRYSIHRLASKDPSSPGGGIIQAAFKLPSGCFCYVKDDLRPKNQRKNNHRNPFDDPEFRGSGSFSRHLRIEGEGKRDEFDQHYSGTSEEKTIVDPGLNPGFKLDNEFMARHFPYIRLAEQDGPQKFLNRFAESRSDDSDYILTLKKVLPDGNEVPVEVLINVDDKGRPSTSTFELLKKLNKAFELNYRTSKTMKSRILNDDLLPLPGNNHDRSPLLSRDQISTSSNSGPGAVKGVIHKDLGSSGRQIHYLDSNENASMVILADILTHLQQSKSGHGFTEHLLPQPQALINIQNHEPSQLTFNDDSLLPSPRHALNDPLSDSTLKPKIPFYLNHKANPTKFVTTFAPKNKAFGSFNQQQNGFDPFIGEVKMPTVIKSVDFSRNDQGSTVDEDLGGILITKKEGDNLKASQFLPFRNGRQRQPATFETFPKNIINLADNSSDPLGDRRSKSIDARQFSSDVKNDKGEIIRYIHPREVFELLSDHSKQTLMRARQVIPLDEFVNVAASSSFRGEHDNANIWPSTDAEFRDSYTSGKSKNGAENESYLDNLGKSSRQTKDAQILRQHSNKSKIHANENLFGKVTEAFVAPSENDWVPITRKSSRKPAHASEVHKTNMNIHGAATNNFADLHDGGGFNKDEYERLKKNHKLSMDGDIPKFFNEYFINQKTDFWSAFAEDDQAKMLRHIKKEAPRNLGTIPPIDQEDEDKKSILMQQIHHNQQDSQGGNKFLSNAENIKEIIHLTSVPSRATQTPLKTQIFILQQPDDSNAKESTNNKLTSVHQLINQKVNPQQQITFQQTNVRQIQAPMHQNQKIHNEKIKSNKYQGVHHFDDQSFQHFASPPSIQKSESGPNELSTNPFNRIIMNPRNLTPAVGATKTQDFHSVSSFGSHFGISNMEGERPEDGIEGNKFFGANTGKVQDFNVVAAAGDEQHSTIDNSHHHLLSDFKQHSHNNSSDSVLFGNSQQISDSKGQHSVIHLLPSSIQTHDLDHYVWNDQYNKPRNEEIFTQSMNEVTDQSELSNFKLFQGSNLNFHSVHSPTETTLFPLEHLQNTNGNPAFSQIGQIFNSNIQQLQPVKFEIQGDVGSGPTFTQDHSTDLTGFSEFLSESVQAPSFFIHQNGSHATGAENVQQTNVQDSVHSVNQQQQQALKTQNAKELDKLFRIAHSSHQQPIETQMITRQPELTSSATEDQVQRPILFHYELPPPAHENNVEYSVHRLIKETAPYHFNMANIDRISQNIHHIPSHTKRPARSWNPFGILG
ncbi:uncharacterized protein LOC108666987 [Hyalella azteca]|uniref:Uncharacterized protein LOC108666987 n=1 Tax=Hyalella azteca TaxID=294128 RepID=A0A8B7N884_HYAAZ|nr:uncharacterized protein LOC108666987 [Hyalella azteca]